jgi:succinyl-diaminopimelate desuccinylase
VSDLLARAAELVAIPSVSHQEGPLADHVENLLRSADWLNVDRVGDNVVARTVIGRDRRLLLAGHLDTVPGADQGARLDGETLWGLGAADMKGGLAVMLELAMGLPEPSSDVTYVFYAAEEVARAHNGLLTIEQHRPDLLVADAAILGEPTLGVVEAGCQGVVKLELRLRGRRAHTARPWMGVNAIHRLGPVLDRVATWSGREPVLDGCRYRESLQAVAVAGGGTANVVPDLATVLLTHRYAPDRSLDDAEDEVRAALSPLVDHSAGDELIVVDHAPAASPQLDDPFLQALLRASGRPARAKLGWTDVAFFAGRGTPAANFGPGDPELAHGADERLERSDIVAVHSVLRSLLS